MMVRARAVELVHVHVLHCPHDSELLKCLHDCLDVFHVRDFDSAQVNVHHRV